MLQKHTEQNQGLVFLELSGIQQQQQQQQLSHLSQVFGVGYMNQKRITPDRAHGSA